VLCNETDGKKCENKLVGFSEFKHHLMTVHEVSSLEPEYKSRNDQGDGGGHSQNPFCIPLTELASTWNSKSTWLYRLFMCFFREEKFQCPFASFFYLFLFLSCLFSALRSVPYICSTRSSMMKVTFYET